MRASIMCKSEYYHRFPIADHDAERGRCNDREPGGKEGEKKTEKGGNERMEKAMYIIWVPDGSCVGPDMQKRGCRTELEYPRGLI